MLLNPAAAGQLAGGWRAAAGCTDKTKKKTGGGDTDWSPQCKREFLEEG